MRSFRIKPFAVLLLVSLFIAAFVYLDSRYTQFRGSLTELRGVKLADARDEVLYRLGTPSHVIDPKTLDSPEAQRFQLVYSVNAEPDDVNRMPAGKRIEDYLEWSYEASGDPARLTVTFGANGQVKSLGVYCTSAKCWEAIAGIEGGATEEEVLRLGTPHVVKVESATKTVVFEDLGVKVYLTKGKAYMVEISGPQQPGSSRFRHFIHTLL
ncbi:hypothetical protein ASC95_08420 [Pelomonas sp. Root1217]|nr:hypothetical protein ASC95_08420 [Pelomonas sp. Root1217]